MKAAVLESRNGPLNGAALIGRGVSTGPGAGVAMPFSYLIGALILLPMILAYTAYAYWVFRGKVRPGDGYH